MIPFWDVFGEFTTHFRTYFSGEWDVHWGYGILAWPYGWGTQNPGSKD